MEQQLLFVEIEKKHMGQQDSSWAGLERNTMEWLPDYFHSTFIREVLIFLNSQYLCVFYSRCVGLFVYFGDP